MGLGKQGADIDTVDACAGDEVPHAFHAVVEKGLACGGVLRLVALGIGGDPTEARKVCNGHRGIPRSVIMRASEDGRTRIDPASARVRPFDPLHPFEEAALFHGPSRERIEESQDAR